MTEPQPADPHGPRYSTRPFPAYRFVPGQTPHPRRHPHGHSYGQAEPNPALFPAEEWQKSDDYLYGIDLYNFAYWWECHEVFEGLWHAAGRETEQANFFQALIQLAAAHLKQFLGSTNAARNLLRCAEDRLRILPSRYSGVGVAELLTEIRTAVDDSHYLPSSIRLSRKCELPTTTRRSTEPSEW